MCHFYLLYGCGNSSRLMLYKLCNIFALWNFQTKCSSSWRHHCEQRELDHSLFSARSSQYCVFSLISLRQDHSKFCSRILSQNGEHCIVSLTKNFNYMLATRLSWRMSGILRRHILFRYTWRIYEVWLVIKSLFAEDNALHRCEKNMKFYQGLPKLCRK